MSVCVYEAWNSKQAVAVEDVDVVVVGRVVVDSMSTDIFDLFNGTV